MHASRHFSAVCHTLSLRFFAFSFFIFVSYFSFLVTLSYGSFEDYGIVPQQPGTREEAQFMATATVIQFKTITTTVPFENYDTRHF